MKRFVFSAIALVLTCGSAMAGESAIPCRKVIEDGRPLPEETIQTLTAFAAQVAEFAKAPWTVNASSCEYVTLIPEGAKMTRWTGANRDPQNKRTTGSVMMSMSPDRNGNTVFFVNDSSDVKNIKKDTYCYSLPNRRVAPGACPR